MTGRNMIKSILLRGCAPAALASAVLILPQAGAAQAFNASPTVVQGNVNINRTVTGVDTITVQGQNAVIDWQVTPLTAGQDLTFLPVNNTADYRGAAAFAVLNRVYSLNFNPVVFDGLVRSVLVDANGGPIGPGGMVAFYAPSGILVGPTGRFEVPQLVLTTHDVDLASFQNFASGSGTLDLSGDDGPSIIISAGGSVEGLPEDSYFIAAAPNIDMAGDVYVNGSTAYIASNSAQVEHSSGLFNIFINDPTTTQVAIQHTGSTGGPSSTGAGDEHVIYAIARAANTGSPTQMLFSGNLGFEPAVSAGVVNGDIILSANYDVNGRVVAGGDNRLGADSYFGSRNFNDAGKLDIFVDNVAASSNLLAIGTDQTSVSGISSFADDLVVVGRDVASISAATGDVITVDGDLMVSARNFTNRGGPGGFSDVIGGFASVYADADSLVTVSGRTQVTADALTFNDNGGDVIGSALGGQAQIFAHGGNIQLTGATRVSAEGFSDATGIFASSGTMRGGLAEFLAVNGGQLDLAGDLTASASARSPDLFASLASPGANASGGDVSIGVGSGGGTLNVGGNTVAASVALVGTSSAASGLGGTAIAGSINVSAIDDGSMSFGGTAVPGGNVQLNAIAVGGNMIAGGNGGRAQAGNIEVSAFNSIVVFAGDLVLTNQAYGGLAPGNGGVADANLGSTRVIADAGTITVAGSLNLDLSASGGNSQSGAAGGDALGGNANIVLQNESSLAVGGQTFLYATALGGESDSGQAGAALSGNVSLEAQGLSFANLHDTTIGTRADGGQTFTGIGGQGTAGNSLLKITPGSSVEITGGLSSFALAFGGNGNGPNGGGIGGDALGGGVAIDVAGQDSLLHVTGLTTLDAQARAYLGANATGGDTAITVTAAADIRLDGDVRLSSPGNGGYGLSALTQSTGGTALVDLLDATATFGGNLVIEAQSGLSNVSPVGPYGTNATGGFADLLLDNATANVAGFITINAEATGGQSAGINGAGFGQGGTATFQLSNGSTFNAGNRVIIVRANASGGSSQDGNAGEAVGGSALASATGGSIVNIGGLALEAIADGGFGNNLGTSGDGTGGNATLEATTGAKFLLGGSSGLSLQASGRSGYSNDGQGGSGFGGNLLLSLASGGVVDVQGDVSLTADGSGGNVDAATSLGSGTGTGGSIIIDANGAGSQLNSSGNLNINSLGLAGSGNSGFGGNAQILVADGASLDFAGFVSEILDGRGGTAGANFGAGIGAGGLSLIDINGGLVSVGQYLDVTTFGVGGNGPSGGNGTGGSETLKLSNGTLNAGYITLLASGIGGVGTPSDGGAAFGGVVNVQLAQGSTINLLAGSGTGFLTIQAHASGGTTSDGTGGVATGGIGSLSASDGSVANLGGGIFINTTADGGSASGTGVGGNAFGGDTTLRAETDGQFLLGTSQANLYSTGQAGSSQSGLGGSGLGGNALVSLATGGDLAASAITMVADGRGGFADPATATGSGTGTGGSAKFTLDGVGTTVLVANNLNLNANGFGGRGNNGLGGIAEIYASNGADLHVLGTLNQFAYGSGADAIGTFGAGEGIGGSAIFEINNALVTVDQAINVNTFGGGGNGPDGGDGTGGSVTLTVTNGTFNSGISSFTSNGQAGAGSAGGLGGTSLGGAVTATLLGGSDVAATRLIFAAHGVTADMVNGNTGDGFGGTSILEVTEGSTLNASQLLYVGAVGGGGDVSGTGDGGSGFGGDATLLLSLGSTVNVLSGDVAIQTSATGGSTADGNGGNATGGTSLVSATGGSVFNIGKTLSLNATAEGGGGGGNGSGGDAFGGGLTLIAESNSRFSMNLAALHLDNYGHAGATPGGLGGSGIGGDTLISLITGGDLSVFMIDAFADGAGGIVDPATAIGSGTGTGGTLSVNLDGAGTTLLVANNLTLRANGEGGLGNDGIGGLVGIHATNGADLHVVGGLSQEASGSGGATIATSAFGTGTGGTSNLEINNSQVTIEQYLNINAAGSGGSGSGGREGAGGFADILLTNGSLSVNSDFNVSAAGFGGNATGSFAAGQGTGGTASVDLTQGSTLLVNGETRSVTGFAAGGNSVDGAGGDATAGSATVSVTNSAATFNGFLELNAAAQGGNASGSGDGGSAIGGDTSLLVSLNADFTVALGGISVKADGTGGSAFDGIGGAGTGGDAIVEVFDESTLDSGAKLAVTAIGTGGTTIGDGDGGAGSGGSAIMRVNVDGSLNIGGGGLDVISSGISGSSYNAQGGDALGGTSLFEILGNGNATITGLVYVLARGEGVEIPLGEIGTGGAGAGGLAGLDIDGDGAILSLTGSMLVGANGASKDGGDSTGGEASVQLLNGSQLEISNALQINASGFTTQSDASGLAGNGQGGTADFAVAGSTADIGGVLYVEAFSAGGDGLNGGNAIAGDADINIDGSTVTVGADVVLEASALGGTGGFVGGTNGDGGDATGGNARLVVVNSGIFTAAASHTLLSAAANGGSTNTGAAGSATGGLADLTISGSSQANLGVTTRLDSSASGATGISGSDGSATGGTSQINAGSSSSIVIDQALTLAASASSGGNNGNAGAVAGLAQITLNGATLSGNTVDADVRASNRISNAAGGQFVLKAANASTVSLDLLTINARAFSIDGPSEAGSARIELLAGAPSSLAINTINANLSAFGGPEGLTVGGTAGDFLVRAVSGSLSTKTIGVEALGSTASPTASQISAQGGNIYVETLLDVDLTGDLLLSAVQGGLLYGGAANTPRSATFDIQASRLLQLSGGASSVPGFTALTMRLASNDIAITPDSRIAADVVRLVSLNTLDQAVIGGISSEPGYTLTQAEAELFKVNQLRIQLPVTASTTTDVELRDLSLPGAQAGGIGSFYVSTPGSLEVVGSVSLGSAGPDSILSLEAFDYLQITLPNGKLKVADVDGLATGLIDLQSPLLIAADATLATLILDNPLDPSIPAALADDGGASNPSPYISARSVILSSNGSILMQNTGGNGHLDGIETTSSPVRIINTSDTGPLRVIAYGSLSNDAGGLFDIDYFNEALAADTLDGPFTADATLNNCVINDGTCSAPPPPPPDEGDYPHVITDIVTELTGGGTQDDAIEEDDDDEEDEEAIDTAIIEGSSDPFFGVEFPSLVDAPLIDEDPLVADPVTSGTDAATSRTENDQDEGTTR